MSADVTSEEASAVRGGGDGAGHGAAPSQASSADLARGIAQLAAERTRRELAIAATAELAELMAQPYRVPDEKLIREPGTYDVPMRDYVADPVAGGSLSSSGARLIMRPAGPARLRWKLDHPDEDQQDHFDLGKAAHQVVLGDSENHLVVVEASRLSNGSTAWNTNAQKKQVANARAAGLTPIKPETWAQVQAMAAAINFNPTAAGLLHSASGRPEQTLVWRDELTGVWCRARVDWYRTKRKSHRLLVVDFKTTGSEEGAAPDVFAKSAANFGYFVQAAFYLAGVQALGIDDQPAFLLVVQEVKPPYLVNVVELDETSLTLGRNFMRGALNLYAECRRTGQWPGFGPEVDLVSLPAWFLRQYGEEPE